MIQDIGEGRFRNEYRPAEPDAKSMILFYRGRELFLNHQDGAISFLTYERVISQLPMLEGRQTYLFSLDGIKYYLFREEIAGLEEHFPECSWETIEFLRTARPKASAFAGVTGYQLWGWYSARRFCPRCGKPLVPDERERMMHCMFCGQMEYPKICPAVIVAVTNGDRILLTRYAGRTYKKYALIAGFAEIGETIEETVQREVMEEVGLKVKNIRYYKSQPWSFSDTLLMGFFAEVDGDDTIRLDEDELSEGVWCTRDEIPEDDGISLTREMMRVFREGGFSGTECPSQSSKLPLL